MVPTVIDDDKAAAAAANRKTPSGPYGCPITNNTGLKQASKKRCGDSEAIENKEEGKFPAHV
jgi:hypothetical protein